jgi:hypothetical protein
MIRFKDFNETAGSSKYLPKIKIGATKKRKLKSIDKFRNKPQGSGDMKYDPKRAATKKKLDDLLYKRSLDKLNKEATYQGKKVTLNKPSAGDVKKSKVFVDPDGDGKATKVNFGDKNMTIKKHIPARRKSFRARHNCDSPGPKDKAKYWSCKAW